LLRAARYSGRHLPPPRSCQPVGRLSRSHHSARRPMQSRDGAPTERNIGGTGVPWDNLRRPAALSRSLQWKRRAAPMAALH
jgi:hypothetical protein